MSKGQVAGPTQTASTELHTKQWEGHPFVAHAVRFAIFIAPLLVAILASLWASRNYPAQRLGINRWVWWVGLSVLATVLVRSLERVTARLTPLAMLFRLSLIFPDQAPSRFSVALKTGSPRSVKRRLAEIQESGQAFSSDDSYSEQMLELVAVLAEHDRMTRGHAERVRAYSELIGEEMGLSEEDLGKLRWSALLHDMGKLHVPAEILNKDGRPTDEEWAVLKEHPAESEAYLEPLADWLGEWRHAAVGHHERWDGKGYPAGLKGVEIPLAARIVAVADAFDVMTSTRSYKKAMPADLARQEVSDKAGTQFDPVVARAFLSIGLGDLRRTAGPLAWLTNLPFLGNVPIGSAITTTAASSATSAATATAATAATAAAAIAVNVVAGVPETPPPLAFAEVDPPTVVLEAVEGLEDEVFEGGFTIEGDGPFTVTILRQPTTGQIALPSDEPVDAVGAFAFTPTSNTNGADSFVLQACDRNSQCTESTGALLIRPVDDALTFGNSDFTMKEGATVVAPLNIVDIDSDPITIDIVSASTNGSARIEDGQVLVSHNGSETPSTIELTIAVSDGTTSVAQAILIQVEPVNDAPVGRGESYTTSEDQVLTLEAAVLLENDTDAEGSTLAVVGLGNAQNGTVQRSGDTITFTPNDGFFGTASFNYTVTDGSAVSTPVRVVIDVAERPELAPTIQAEAFDVDESTAVGSLVTTITGRDPERGPLRYAITGGTGKQLFSVNSVTGEVTAAAPLDYETAKALTLEFSVTDEAGLSATATAPVMILDVDEPPVFEFPVGPFSIEENSALDTRLIGGPAEASDPENASLEYSLIDLSDTFEIDATTGALSLAGPVNFEVTDNYEITVRATDAPNGLFTDQRVTVNVVDVNDAPAATDLVAEPVRETAVPGDLITTVPATDEDGDTLRYSIVGGDGIDIASIDPALGTISLTAAVNYEKKSNYSLTVAITDDNLPSESTQVQVTFEIADQNDAPTVQAGQTFLLSEASNAGDALDTGPLLATDEDGDNITFALNDPTGSFVIDAATGEVTRTNAVINYEMASSYDVEVTLTDVPNLGVTTTPITIVIADANDAPEFVSPTPPLDIDENVPSALVGVVAAVDQDGDALTYEITSNPTAPFRINDDGEIWITSSVDYETTIEFDLTVFVSDDGSPSLTTVLPVTVVVQNVNEAPVAGASQRFAILENSPIGTSPTPAAVAAVDIDGDALTYELNDPAGAFSIDSATGTLTVLQDILDHENQPELPITITVRDPDGLEDTAQAIIEVGEENEFPTIATPVGVVRIEENSSIGALVDSSISATDPEGDTLRFLLTDPSGLFAIDETTGAITVGADGLNHEDTPLHTITVTVDDSIDGGIGTDSVTFDVLVDDINERPEIDPIVPVVPVVLESTAVGSVSEAVTATDPEGTASTWSFAGGTGTTVFAIDPTTGVVTLIAPLDYESTSSYTLTVVATDPLGLEDRVDVTVEIGDVDEAPTIPAGQSVTIEENVVIGSPVDSPLIAIDSEGDPVTWAMIDPTNTFDINPTTGEIFTIGLLDHETTDSYTVTVTATGSPADSPASATVTIDVTNVDEPPQIDSLTFGLREDVPPIPIGRITYDSPEGDPVEFFLVGGTGSLHFAIALDGEISVIAPIDYETATSYNLVVLVRDVANPTLSDTATITINIVDVNEAPVIDANQQFSIVDDEPAGSALSGNNGRITASDPEGDDIAYALVGGTGDSLFDVSTSGQITLIGDVDYDVAQSYTLDIEATDDRSPGLTSIVETVTVDIVSQFGATRSPFFGDVIFNEVLFTAHTTLDVAAGISDEDFVEIVNASATDLDLDGWVLADHPLGATDLAHSTSTTYPTLLLNSDDRLVHWFTPLQTSTSNAAGADHQFYASDASQQSLRLRDDLFLYDSNGLLVAYLAWGDDADADSEVAARPPLTQWDLWDDTYESLLVSTTRTSLSLAEDGDPSKSGCWEPTESGDAQDPGRCGALAPTADRDLSALRINSVGQSNTTNQTLGGLVISEFAVAGMAGGAMDNFVEVYNASPFVFDLRQVELNIVKGGVLQETVALTPSTTADFLQSGEHVLLGQVDGAYGTIGTGADQIFTTELNGWNYGLELVFVPNGTTLDMVGSTTNATKEGGGIPASYRLIGREQSYERSNGTGSGSCIDTDDNAADFTKNIDSIDPQTRQDPPTMCTTPEWVVTGGPAVVISEIQSLLSASEDEFIELVNRSTAPVSLDGYTIYEDGAFDSGDVLAALPAVVLEPGERFLLGGEGYAGASDLSFTKNISPEAVVELRDPDGEMVDEVWFGWATAKLPSLSGTAISYTRRNNGCEFTGAAIDDFDWTAAPTPTLMGATPEPCS